MLNYVIPANTSDIANASSTHVTLTADDRGMTGVSLFFVSLSDNCWGGLAVIELACLVYFLAHARMNEQGEDLSVYQLLPLAVLWSTLGIVLVFFNKFLFLQAGTGFGFPYTVFLMWFHALFGTISMNVLRLARPSMMPAAVEWRLSAKNYCINIFPIAGLQAGALTMGNTAYLHISIAYIQMVKNTTSAFVFMFSVMLGMEKGNFSNTLAVVMVVAGLLLTTVGELDFSMIGFLFQMGSTIFDAFRLSLTKIVLSSKHAVNLDPMSALYFACPTILLVLSVPLYFTDYQQITFAKVWSLKLILLCNATMAFGLNVTSMFFMKRCGATTYALTGVIKDVCLILVCCALFQHPMTVAQFLGFVVSLAGFHLFNQLKSDKHYLSNYMPKSLAGASEEEPLLGKASAGHLLEDGTGRKDAAP